MKEHFQKRIDETRQAYIDALTRLKEGRPNHPKLKGAEYSINATTIALEARKSRNPLYNTHKDILDMIHETMSDKKEVLKKVKEVSEIELLQTRVRELEEQNKKLININATLMLMKS